MTALGRFYKAHPNGHDPADQGMCPDQFGYLDPPENCNALHGLSEFPELMSCKECWLREIPEENADTGNAKNKPDIPKEKNMIKNVAAQCIDCRHNEVCKYKYDLSVANDAANEALAKLTGKNDPDAKGMDLSFIYPLELKCKHRYAHVSSTLTTRDCTATNKAYIE